MNFLSIDCSSETNSLFIKYKNKTFSKLLQSDKFINDSLAKLIIDFMKGNDINLNNLSTIFINQGPGNFSSLRSSLAIAKGFSISKNLKLFGYNTFIWACTNFFNKNDTIYSLLTFKEKYFIQKFDKNLKAVSKPTETKETDIINKYCNELIVTPKHSTKNINKKILKIKNLQIVDLSHKELEFLQLKGLLDEEIIKPIYLT